MPSKSVAQADLMRAAEHGADFPMAKKVRKSMSHDQMHEFSVTPNAGLPVHVLKGSSSNIAHENTKTFKSQGMSEHDAVKKSIKLGHPNRHKNLGRFLHQAKRSK